MVKDLPLLFHASGIIVYTIHFDLVGAVCRAACRRGVVHRVIRICCEGDSSVLHSDGRCLFIPVMLIGYCIQGEHGVCQCLRCDHKGKRYALCGVIII